MDIQTWIMADNAIMVEIVPDIWARHHQGHTTIIERNHFPLHVQSSCTCITYHEIGKCKHLRQANDAANQIGEIRFAEAQAKRQEVA
jgi:hypothetical protein